MVRSNSLQHRDYLQDDGHLPLKAVEQMMLPPASAPAPADPPPLADPPPRPRVVMTVPGRPDVAIRPAVPAG